MPLPDVWGELLRTASSGSSQERLPYRGPQRSTQGRWAKNAGAETGRRPLLVPPARLSGALSQGLWTPSMHLSGHYCGPHGAEGAHEKGRRPRRGIRAAGPGNSFLPDCVQVKHRERTSQNSSSTHSGDLLGWGRCLKVGRRSYPPLIRPRRRRHRSARKMASTVAASTTALGRRAADELDELSFPLPVGSSAPPYSG
jgi:hypothetical protein